MAIRHAGMEKIYYLQGYADLLSKEMLKEAGVELIKLENILQGENR